MNKTQQKDPAQRGGGRQISTINIANAERGSGSSSPSSEGVSLPMSLIKALRGKSSGGNGSQSSNGGSDNNSDNSALISLGNTSFGFNFDREEGREEGMMNSSSDGDSDGKVTPNYETKQRGSNGHIKSRQVATSQRAGSNPKPTAATSSGNQGSASMVTASISSTHNDAAAEAIANLQSIASAYSNKGSKSGESTLMESYRNAFFGQGRATDEVDSCSDAESTSKQSLKRKTLENADNDSGGYNTDDDENGGTKNFNNDNLSEVASMGGSDVGSQRGGRKKKKLDEFKREERNAREKERSFRISRQITELRGLLSSGGVIVPKGTKSSVLTEAANYIRMLQQHQYRSEIDRHQLVQQIQMIGGGALGQPAATTVRHVAAQNGVWSLGNFGGVPPKSAMMYHQSGTNEVANEGGNTQAAVEQQRPQPVQDENVLPNKIETHDYRYVFNSCTVGMAIASMGGAFIDCNRLFSQLSNYTKQEVCSMTVFNLTAREDLQHAFDLISQMLSAPTDAKGKSNMSQCVLRGSMKTRTDLGLSVSLIKGEDSVAKCFCITLVSNPASPFDTSKPTPATIDFIQAGQRVQTKEEEPGNMESTPAYTTG